jgi:tetratricopeptide (TPR) repeat protein
VLLESNHQPIDPKRFLKVIESAPPIPAPTSLLACFARADYSQVTCIWESESQEQLQQFIEPIVGGAAKNSYYSVELLTGFESRAETGPEKLENPYHLHEMGKRLAKSSKPEAALAVFQLNAIQNPHKWFVPAGLARGYAAMGDFDKAKEFMKTALERAPIYRKEHVKELLARLERRENLN